MKHEFRKISAVLLATVLCVPFLAGDTSVRASDETEVSSAGWEDAEEQATSDASNEYDLPMLGLTVTFPDALMKHMNQGEVIMFNNVIPDEDGSALQYGYLSWCTAEGNRQGTEDFNLDEMMCAGMLGVYRAELADMLDELTGCDEHQELGQSEDGAYKYYLSINTAADEALVKEIREVKAVITEMEDYSEPQYEETAQEQQPEASVGDVGEFTTQDVNGETVTQDIFSENELTMVNVFATWCSPCVAEMPDLEKLYRQMKDRNVGVVGFVMDVLNEEGEIVEEDLERAQLLVEKTGVTYPVILPDDTYLNGRIMSIEAFPETFFVDQNGNIVGETYSGSGSLEDWLEVVEKELKNPED